MPPFDFHNLLIFNLGEVAFLHPLALWIGLPLLIPVGWFLYVWQRRSLTSAPRSLCGVLTGLRLFILAALCFYLAQPYRREAPAAPPKPVFAVLFDYSRSMDLPAGPFETDDDLAKIAAAAGYAVKDGAVDPATREALNRVGRSKLAQTALTHASLTSDDGRGGATPPLLCEALSRKFDLRYYSFASDLTQLGVNPSKPDFPDPPHPGGKSTQIGDALDQLRADLGGRKVAGVLVFSDGQNTAGRSLTEVGRACADADVPVFPVPVGPVRQLQDVAVVGVDAPSTVSVGDAVRVAATIESKGFDKRVVKVQLWEGDRPVKDEANTNVEKQVTLSDTEQQHVDLTFKATKAGAHYLTVKVPPQPEEPDYLQGNNADTAFVRVSDEKIKVLFLEGLPRWDYRFLKNAMRRDNGLTGRTGKEPDVVLESEWRRLSSLDQLDALPRTLDQLAEYHTIVLGDVSPKMLDKAFVELLAKAVRERGVGLVVEAGPLSMPHKYDDSLAALLPVRLTHGLAGKMPRETPSFHIELAPEGQLHDAMRLFDDPTANQNGWAQMPPYYWCAAAEKAAPGATVLAWNPATSPAGGKTPLIAQSYAGQGQVLFVGTDSTWLWRQNVGDRFFYKFWGQAIRAVARNDKTTQKKSWLEVRPVHVGPGDAARVELMAFAADGSPRTDPTLTVQARSGDEVGPVEMTADPNVKGRYTGKFTPKNSGEYRLTYAPDAGASAETTLPVAAAPDELKRPNLNQAALEQLAADSHGKLIELYDLGSVEKELKEPPPPPPPPPSLPPVNPWDEALLAVVIALLYSLDVGLRRLGGLS